MNRYTFPLPGNGVHIITAKTLEEAKAKHNQVMDKYAKRMGGGISRKTWARAHNSALDILRT